jgi:peptidase S41-like protein
VSARKIRTRTRVTSERPDVGWRFSAAYRLALMWQQAGDYVRSEAAYLEALRLEPGHLPSLYNLAVTQIRLGTYSSAKRTLERLAQIVGLTKPTNSGRWPLEAYPLAYSQALVREYAQELDASAWSHALAAHSLRESDETVRRLEHPALLLHAGIQVSARARRGRDLAQVADAFVEGLPVPDREALTRELNDPALVVAYVQAHDEGNTRSSYNLACYATRLAALVPSRRGILLQRGVQYAELALQDARLVAWAERDPSLELARHEPRWRSLVAALRPKDASDDEPTTTRTAPEQPPETPTPTSPEPEQPDDSSVSSTPEDPTSARIADVLYGLNAGVSHPGDPVARLRAMGQTADVRIATTVAQLRDPATQYELPTSSRNVVAALPFELRECIDDGRWTVTAMRVEPGIRDPRFTDGVEIVEWNGEPIDAVLERHAGAMAARSPEERRARALAWLTHRPQGLVAQHDEEYVTLRFGSVEGAELRLAWDYELVHPPIREGAPFESLDPLMERIQRLRCRARGTLEVRTIREHYQVLQMQTFQVADSFTSQVAGKLAETKTEPPRGLIVDIRGNPGGSVVVAERLLQLFTTTPIEPQPVQVVASDLSHRLSRVDRDLLPWHEPIRTALAAGERFTRALPLTKDHAARCNDHHTPNPLPAVLLVDALCAGAADVFIAGWRNHRIGPILSPERRRGGVGGFTRTYSQLTRRLPALKPIEGELHLSIGRGIYRDGIPVGERGVVPDELYDTTRADLQTDRHLLARAIELLRSPTSGNGADT